jgi:uncharacterized membrane protein
MLKRGRFNQAAVAMILLLVLTLITAAAQVAAPAPMQEEAGQKLILNIYLDETGRALVTGYAQDPSGLTFLSASTYRYDNDTLQLYALTDALTRKEGDLWSLKLRSGGYYDDYHLTFYLPGDAGIKGINITDGLQYQLSSSNQSLVTEIQGYDVNNPGITINYQQPLQDWSERNSFYPFALSLALLLSLIFAFYLFWKRPRNDAKSSFDSAQISASEPKMKIDNAKNAKDSAMEVENGFDEDNLRELAEEETGTIQSNGIKPFSSPSSDQEGCAEDEINKKIEVTSEMRAVMETLTPRERAILETLIKAGGRMNQSDLRYETETPRSSLSGILLSLERRRIIIKDKSRHTNVIELSDWFLSKKERY